ISKQGKLTAVTFGPHLKRGPNITHQDLTKLSHPHSSHVWPTSDTWPKCDPPEPHLTSSHVWPTSKPWPKRDHPIPLPKLTRTNLEQARSRLNILRISSQAHTPSSQVWSTFLGEPKGDPPDTYASFSSSPLIQARSCLDLGLGPNVTHPLKAQDLQQFFLRSVIVIQPRFSVIVFIV
ncbi:hypothetical protein PIB30_096388, partial [Stylosanthes scabra]|nr:hypothetical protein [Stylosanthes scabra]